MTYRAAAAQHHGRGLKHYALIVLALSSIWSSRDALAASQILFDVPEGPANQTLDKYAKQAELEVLYDYAWQMQTCPLRGFFTQKKALHRLLSGTGLTFDYLPNGKVAVKRAPQGPVGQCKDIPPPGPKAMEEVLIRTGTHIPDPQPRGAIADDVPVVGPVGSDLKILGQAEIHDLGVTTTAELLRKRTENFGGGPSEDTHLVGEETKSNAGFGQGVNFRGLGARATLVLINGRRLAPSGNEASFVDVSMIPLSAIDHVEFLLDSASAVYGSDAVGGVVNFITKDNYTRKRYQGGETGAEVGSVTQGSQRQYRLYQLWGRAWETGDLFTSFEAYHRDALSASDRPYTSSDLSRYHGPDFNTLASNPGTLSVGNLNYAIPSGQTGVGLDFLSLHPGSGNFSDLYRNVQVLPSQDQRSFFVGIHQGLGDSVTVFGTVLGSDRHASADQGDQRLYELVPASNPFLLNKPIGTDVRVAYDLADDFGILSADARVRAINVTLGADFALRSDWHLSTSIADVVEIEHLHTFHAADVLVLRSQLATTFNPFGEGANTDPGTLRSAQIEGEYHSRSELREFHASSAGPLYDLPGGKLRGAFGTELRYQRFATELSPPALSNNLTRQLVAGFAEVVAPIVGPANAHSGLQKVDLSVAARYEHYTDFGSAVTPRVGVSITPVLGLELFGSWGRSFRAPNPGDLDEHSNIAFLQSLPDSSSAGGSSRVLILSGKNADLHAEHATSGTFGISFAPQKWPGFRAKANYFHIVFEDRIQRTGYDFHILDNPSVQDIVTRHPSAQVRSHICSDTNNHFDGTVQECLQAPIDALVDLRVRNLGTLHTEGIDFYTSYEADSAWGHLTFDLSSTYLLDYSQIAMPHDTRVRLLNTENNPINLQVIGGFKWKWRDAWARIGVNYANSYRDTVSVPERNISPWLTFDLHAGYEFGDRLGAALKNLEMTVSVQNVFDRDPPFAVNNGAHLGYDEENADPTGRVLRFSIRKKW